ncbi:MAG: T9SS type A sorting domain-containing protein [Candidatus Goldbacteria bacterium]|nr:T9SS type A sorting domain-containing protein [Candidatus Goldiibacteriota bacterium]
MKKLFYLLVILIIYTYIYSDVTSIQVFKVGYDGKYLQATSKNNPVLHIKINDDGNGDVLKYFGVYNSLNSWYIGSATEPASIAPNSVKLWYCPVDTDNFSESTAIYVAYLPTDGGDWWYNNLNFPVVNGSGFWVTIDISDNPSFGSVEFQIENISFQNSSVTLSDEPVKPYVLLITSVTPAELLQVSHSPGTMQQFVSTGQTNIIPMELNFYNSSPETSADITVNNITITVRSYPIPGSILSPSSVISSIKIQDKQTGFIYGGIYSPNIPAAISPFSISLAQLNIPAQTTVTANVVISITDTASSADIDFVLSLDDWNSLNAYDYYTFKKISVTASLSDSFPLYSNFAKIQKKVNFINSFFIDSIPPNINKGATNVVLLKLRLENPGDISTASAELYNLKLYLKDNINKPIIPNTLFSKISITDETGNIKYSVKTYSAIESSGNIINFPLITTAGIVASSSVTIVVRADILPSTIVNNFKIGLESADDITCRDKNTLNIVPVIPDTTPSYTSLSLLSSSFRVSHQQRMPQNIYKNQKNVHLMDITFKSPLSFGNGNILIRGITLTAKNASGQPINFLNCIDKIVINTSSGIIQWTSMPLSSNYYLSFPTHITVTPSGETIYLYADISKNINTNSLKISLEDASAINAYQDNDPLRQIFITADTGDTFPMSSGTGFISGETSTTMLSSYPNPFYYGSFCRFAYYLNETSKVTIKIFDLMGNNIKTIIQDAIKISGSHNEDIWDGKSDNEKPVMAGTYIVKIEIDSGGNKKILKDKITILK